MTHDNAAPRHDSAPAGTPREIVAIDEDVTLDPGSDPVEQRLWREAQELAADLNRPHGVLGRFGYRTSTG